MCCRPSSSVQHIFLACYPWRMEGRESRDYKRCQRARPSRYGTPGGSSAARIHLFGTVLPPFTAQGSSSGSRKGKRMVRISQKHHLLDKIGYLALLWEGEEGSDLQEQVWQELRKNCHPWKGTVRRFNVDFLIGFHMPIVHPSMCLDNTCWMMGLHQKFLKHSSLKDG